jgi:hypothetical protein
MCEPQSHAVAAHGIAGLPFQQVTLPDTAPPEEIAARGPFIIHAIGRSRTAWLAKFLSYGEWRCEHEQAIRYRSIAEARRAFWRPRSGTVETAAMFGWRLLRHHLPRLRTIVIRRPVEEVLERMLAVDLKGQFAYDKEKLRAMLERGDRLLREISALPGVLTLAYDELEDEQAIAALFEHCLPYRFDRAWWERCKEENVQIDVPGLLAYYHQNRAAVDGFKSVCWRELRALRAAGLIRREVAHG